MCLEVPFIQTGDALRFLMGTRGLKQEDKFFGVSPAVFVPVI
jgi:hypothetical protein